MEEAPENGKESSNSAHANGMNDHDCKEGLVIDHMTLEHVYCIT